MLKVWGRPNSINVQKVMWTIGELGLAHEHIVVGGQYGGLDTDAYGALNPNRRIPVIDDDGVIIWESNAIVRYLSAKHASGTLWPEDPAARSLADRWMDWQASTLIADLVTVFWGLIRTPEHERDWMAIGNAASRLNQAMRILNDQLTKTPFVAGDAMTMGDIPIGALVHRWLNLPMERPELPAIAAYYKRLGERPAYRQHVMIPLT